MEHGTQGQQQPQVALPTKEQVDAAAAALNVDMLAKMETAAGTAGDAQARAYIGSARLMAKRQLEQNNNQGEQQ